MVVVGAGFGGVGAGSRLARHPVDVTIVDRRNHHVFQPLLYQVATAGLNPADIAQSVRGIFQGHDNIDFRLATVEGVDFDRRCVRVDNGDPLFYDWLVLAPGSETRWFGIPGVEEHAIPLKTIEDALRLRAHVLEQFELAAADRHRVDEGGLTFVIVGGGPTGVELAGAFVELFAVLARDFHHFDVGQARVVLVELTDHLLAAFTPESQRSAVDTLRQRGVEVLLGRAVERADPGRVHLEGGDVIPTKTLVWAAGVEPSQLGGVLGLEPGPGGRIPVRRDLRVPGHAEVFLIGDLAAARDRHGEFYPQLAAVALQQGHHAGTQIGRLVSGRKTKPFRYVNYGEMATIGRNAAVAELAFGIRLRGAPGWYAWLLVHLVRLMGMRNRASVFLNWAWNYLTYDRSARLIIGRASAPRPAPTSDSGTRPRP